jgi:hypothetical protein
MSQLRSAWSDEEVETMMGNLLRVGVVVAATVILLGGFIYLVRHGTTMPSYQVFRGEPADLRSLGGIWGDAFPFAGGGSSS